MYEATVKFANDYANMGTVLEVKYQSGGARKGIFCGYCN